MIVKPHVITWQTGYITVRQVVKRDGPALILGCQIDDGPFKPFIKLTFTDSKEQALFERELKR